MLKTRNYNLIGHASSCSSTISSRRVPKGGYIERPCVHAFVKGASPLLMIKVTQQDRHLMGMFRKCFGNCACYAGMTKCKTAEEEMRTENRQKIVGQRSGMHVHITNEGINYNSRQLKQQKAMFK
uniref:Uncharacterized protein n=1 Tax=Glossina austeni TaxID=7395 RepID=A0A1A9UGS6_GLOAU